MTSLRSLFSTKQHIYKPGSVPQMGVAKHQSSRCWRLSLILSRVLLRASIASYPPTHASSAQALVYLELQPIVCSYHFLSCEIVRRFCRDQTLLPDGR